MGIIRVLDDQLVNQIAAGEVVERPAAVVKELVENALDAGATRVDIALEAGGRARVRVSDNGSGMSREDAILSIERHATSKIRSNQDLFAIHTLGFRGEALPSIASVSRFTLTTRRVEDEVGTKITVEGGRLSGVDPVGCPVGTTVDVRSLFFNVPARRKFLRTEGTELGHSLDIITREAMWRPEVAFSVSHDGREVLRAPSSDRLGRIRNLLGDQARALVPIAGTSAGITIEGFIAPSGIHAADSQAMALFVNGRFVKDPILRKSVMEAYQGLTPRGRYPIAVIAVHLNPDRVDVNVHPSKTEVRFRDPGEVVQVVSEMIRGVLNGVQSSPLESREANELSPFAKRRPQEIGSGPLFDKKQVRMVPAEVVPALVAHPDDDPQCLAREAAVWEHPPPSMDLHSPQESRFPIIQPAKVSPPVLPPAELASAIRSFADVTIVARIGRWWVGKRRDTPLFIDAEQAIIQGLMAQWHHAPPTSKRLLLPEVVDVSRQVATTLSERSSQLRALGVELEVLGGTIAVLAIPESIPLGLMTALVQKLGSDDDMLRSLAECATLDPEPNAWLAELGRCGVAEKGLMIEWTEPELLRRVR